MDDDTQEIECERYPVDYDTIRQGDRLEPEKLTDLFGEPPGTTKYQLRVLKLSKQIERELWARGKRWTTRIHRDGINVLTDAEASEHNDRLCAQRLDQFTGSFRRLSAVDTGKLDEDEIRRHDRRLVTRGAYIAALKAARKAIEPVACERKHPRLTE